MKKLKQVKGWLESTKSGKILNMIRPVKRKEGTGWFFFWKEYIWLHDEGQEEESSAGKTVIQKMNAKRQSSSAGGADFT